MGREAARLRAVNEAAASELARTQERGDAALAAFAAALRTNLLEYQSAAHEFELFAWLETPPAEAQLLKLLAPRAVSTRASVVVPALLRQPEDAAIAADHRTGEKRHVQRL